MKIIPQITKWVLVAILALAGALVVAGDAYGSVGVATYTTMAKTIDLTGQRFGKLVVLKQGPSLELPDGRIGQAQWECLCDCGNKTLVRGQGLRSGNTQSCSCLRSEVTRQKFTIHGNAKRSQTTKEYQIWCGIKTRCFDENSERHQDYGGRGITMCDRWKNDFTAFLSDMGPCPSGHSIDRYPNNNGHYEPGNCRWATASQQARNTRCSIFVDHEGARWNLADLAEHLGLHYSSLYHFYQTIGLRTDRAILAARKEQA